MAASRRRSTAAARRERVVQLLCLFNIELIVFAGTFKLAFPCTLCLPPRAGTESVRNAMMMSETFSDHDRQPERCTRIRHSYAMKMSREIISVAES